MKLHFLQKVMYGSIALVMLVLTALPVMAQPEVIWERNQRTGALANVPSWLTGANERGIAIGTHEGQTRLYVASRTGGSFIRVLDAYTGADIDAATSAFDMSSVTGGLYAVNDIGTTTDGKLVVGNMTTNASTAGFKVYVFEQSGGAPIASHTYTTAELRRLGDKISVFGSWADGTLEVWSVHAANPGEVHKVKTADQGQNWTTEVVTLSAPTAANQTTVGSSSVTRAPNGDMFINGNGSLVKRFTAAGEYIANQNVGTVGSMSGVRYFEAGGTPYIAVYAYRELPAGTDPVLGYTKFFDITDPEAPVKVAASPKLASAASGNAISGDVEVLVHEDGSYIIYALGATQGLIAFGNLPDTSVELVAWETQGLSGTTAAPFNATTVAENVAPSGLVRGPALTATGLANGFASSGFNHVDYDAAVTAGSYLGFTVQAEPGYQVSLSSIAYNFRRSGTGPNKFQWAYSVDGGDTFVKFGDEIEYTTNEADGIAFGPFSVAAVGDLQDVTSATTVHLRLYGYGATQPGGTGAIGRLEGNDLVVKGHVEVDPDYVPPTPSSDYLAIALGIHEVPVRMTTGSGSFNASLSDDQLVLTGAFSDLVGTYTMSHIHVGAVSTNGGVVFTLNADVDTDGKGGTYTAENNTFTLNTEQIEALAAGNYYINIHSTEYPGGEIRGQLLAAPNAAPTAATVTAPADGFEVKLEGFFAQTLNVTWTEATDPDDDTVAYIFQLSADTEFTQVVLNVNAGTGTTAALTFGEINALLADNGVNVGQTITLHHRVVSSDGSNVTAGPSNAITIERGEIKAVYTIAEARALPNNTTPIVVEGIVTRAFGREARIQDATGAMGTFQSAGDYFEAIASGAVAQGDLVRITGRRAEFGSLVQVDNITAFEVISRNNALPTPVTVTLAQIRDNGADYESKLVRVEGITINADGDATFSAGTGSGKTYQISDATVSSGEVFFRVPNQLNTTIVGTPIPSVPFVFEGVLGRFNADWQLYAVRGSDVIVPAQVMSGTYFVPKGSNEKGFASLAQAFNNLNEAGANGPVTILIDGDLDETANALTIHRPDITEATSVTIRPAPGKTPTVTISGKNPASFENTGAGIMIFNTSWITIDGSSEVGGDDLDLTIVYNETTVATGDPGVISIVGDAHNNKVLNTNIELVAGAPNTVGLRVRRNNAATTVPSGLHFENNLIGSLDKPFKDGVALYGVGSPLLRVGADVVGNGIYASHRGITTFFVEDNSYVSNAIVVTGSFANPAWYAGIYLAGGAGETDMSENRIYMMGANFSTDGRYVAGIVNNLNAGDILISNNMITTTDAFNNMGSSSALSRWGVVTHREGAGEIYYVIHNSVYLNNQTNITGNSAGVGFEASSGFFNPASTTASYIFDIRNNIFKNEGRLATSYAIHWPLVNILPSSDYNNYFVRTSSDANTAFFRGSAVKTIADWRAASTKDENTTTRNVEFVSSSDLTLAGASIGDNQLAGIFVEFVPIDINGRERNPDAPYKGAYESEVTITSIDSKVDEIPGEFALRQNYPNPFNPSTQINFELPVEARVELQVYTVTGQLVATLVNDVRPAGYHQITFDASRLASGVYIYRLRAGDFTQTQKMTLIK